eukprot:g81570.t1
MDPQDQSSPGAWKRDLPSPAQSSRSSSAQSSQQTSRSASNASLYQMGYDPDSEQDKWSMLNLNRMMHAVELERQEKVTVSGLMSGPAPIHRVASQHYREEESLQIQTEMDRDAKWRQKLVIVLVGLPARGKSYLGSKVVGFLNWQGIRAKMFNAGNYRREVLAGQKQDAAFFASKSCLDDIAMAVLGSCLDWLEHSGDVAVFDATNSTRSRRKAVLAKCAAKSPRLPVLFCESICRDPVQLRQNLVQKVTHSPDYREMPLEKALEDLQRRIIAYEMRVQDVGGPAEDKFVSYIKLMDTMTHVTCNRIHGRLQNLTSQFFMSIHLKTRPIYLVRTGAHVTPEAKWKRGSTSKLGSPLGSPRLSRQDKGQDASQEVQEAGSEEAGLLQKSTKGFFDFLDSVFGSGATETTKESTELPINTSPQLGSGNKLSSMGPKRNSGRLSSLPPPKIANGNTEGGLPKRDSSGRLSGKLHPVKSLPRMEREYSGALYGSDSIMAPLNDHGARFADWLGKIMYEETTRIRLAQEQTAAEQRAEEKRKSPDKHHRGLHHHGHRNKIIPEAMTRNFSCPSVPLLPPSPPKSDRSSTSPSTSSTTISDRSSTTSSTSSPAPSASSPPFPIVTSTTNTATNPADTTVASVTCTTPTEISNSKNSFENLPPPRLSKREPSVSVERPRVPDATKVDTSVFNFLLAASKGENDTVQSLVDAKGKINCQDYDGRTPLHLAAANGHSDTVKLILALKGDAAASDRFYNKPLDDAEREGGNNFKETAKVLREHMGAEALKAHHARPSWALDNARLQIFTSTQPRALQTCAPVLQAVRDAEMREEHSLCSVDMGSWKGLTIEEIKAEFPQEYARWQRDKFNFRFPGGESQHDLVSQLLPVVLEMERQQEAVLVVSHLSVLQVLYGYFLGSECAPNDYHSIPIPQHTLIRLEPTTMETRFKYSEHVNEEDCNITFLVTTEEISHSTKFYK